MHWIKKRQLTLQQTQISADNMYAHLISDFFLWQNGFSEPTNAHHHFCTISLIAHVWVKIGLVFFKEINGEGMDNVKN